ncbi:hypothetical protein Gpo141_00000456 [Globisporangium polare]
MDVILSQLTRAQLQTHSVEALHAELQQLEGVFKSAVQTLQRISSVRDTAAKFLVDCDDSATLAHLTRIHSLREDVAMRLDLLTTEIHMRRRDAERQARKKTASPSPVKPERPPRMQAPPVAPSVLVIDCMSPLSSPASVSVSSTRTNPPSPPPRNEVEISGSDTESDDEDIPVSALLGRQQQQQLSGPEPQRCANTRTIRNSPGSQFLYNSGSNPESRVKAEAKRTRIPSDAGAPSPAESQSTTPPDSQLQHQVLSANQQQQQQTAANLSKNQLKKLKKKKSKATKKATAGSGGIVHISPSRAERTERRRMQFQKQA